MSNTSRQITHRRHATAAAAHAAAPMSAPAARVEALRRLVAAGRYRVDAKALARGICRAAGVALDE